MAYYGRRRYYRYRYPAKKKSNGRPRYNRRYRFQYRNRKSVYNQVRLIKRLGHPIVNDSQPTAYTQVLNDGAPRQLLFQLNAVTANTDFSELYNEYKIRAVKVSFIPLANVSNMQQSAYSKLIYSAIDTNGGAPLSHDQIRQYNTVRWSPYNRIHSRYFYPRAQINSSTLSGKQPWFSTDNNDGEQYRALIISPPTIDGIPSTEPIYTIECTYYLSFRGTR